MQDNMRISNGLKLAALLFVLACVEGAHAVDIYSPPPLDAAVPSALDISADFQPPEDSPGARTGLRRTSAVLLEEQQGIHPICMVNIPPGILSSDPLQNGDVLIAVNGKPLGRNPDTQFREAFAEAAGSTGVLWVTVWRKGTIERVLIDTGSRPLDLTRTGKAGNTRDWRLGPIGANGWCFSKTTNNGATSKARQIIITAIDDDGPAAGKLAVGDVILGIGDKLFASDARKALAAAIDEAEAEENGGRLTLNVWREGKTSKITVTLPVMGRYSPTTPFNCPKTDRIIDNACRYIKENQQTLLEPNWLGYINGLGLLATGREDVMPMVRELAHAACIPDGEALSVEKHVGMQCWDWSYRTLFLCEYYLRTKDEIVWPSINELATKIALGQSGAGTWGHTYAARQNTGFYHGPLGGYGAINQQGLTLMIVLPLAQKCGVNNKEVKDAIRRGDEFFSYFIGKGTIPYGDHGAKNYWYDDNGKSGAAAIYFDLMGNREGMRFFSDMVLGSAPSGREAGHTGHFWSRLWGGVGAARGGDRSLQVFFQQIGPLFTLERQPDGRFVFQNNVGENGPKGDPKTKWDSTGARLLQLCIPRRVLYITGKDTARQTHLNDERIEQILHAGKLDYDSDARSRLTVDQILQLLHDPLPPTRSIGARALAEQNLNIADQLIALLDSDNRYARYGAAEALCKAGFASKEAADKLIRMMQEDEDIFFRRYAIDALINRDERRGLLTVAKPAIPVLLRMAVEHSPNDPRGVLQQHVARALFYRGNAQPRRGLLYKYGLESADASLLMPAIKDILTNQNGGTRSLTGWVYPHLTPAQIDQLWSDLYASSRYIAPSGIMFSAGIRAAALQTMADYHIKEGLDLAVWHIGHNRGHGSVRVEEALQVIEQYGAHAKRILPELEKRYAEWAAFDAQRRRKTDDMPSILIRKTIDRIKALPDKAAFELVSIADQIKDVKNPYQVDSNP